MAASWPAPLIENVVVDGPYKNADGYPAWGVFIQVRIGPELCEDVLWHSFLNKGDAVNEGAWLEEWLFSK